REFTKVGGISAAPTVLDLKVAADCPAQQLHRLPKRVDACLSFHIARGVGAEEHADAPHALALLRTRRERPRSCATEQRDELAPSHAGHRVSSPLSPLTLSLPQPRPAAAGLGSPWGRPELFRIEAGVGARSRSPPGGVLNRALAGLCHEHRPSKRRCATVREMKEGPSRSAIMGRSQAAASCCGQKPWW